MVCNLIVKEKETKVIIRNQKEFKIEVDYGRSFAVATDYGDWDKNYTDLQKVIVFYRILRPGGSFFDIWKIQTHHLIQYQSIRKLPTYPTLKKLR